MADVTRPSVLPGIFDDFAPRRHKVVRQTSREQYRLQRAKDQAASARGQETGRAACLRLLARFQNQHEHGATGYELFVFADTIGERRWRDIAALRPRLTELFKAGLIEPHTPRRCRVTGAVVRTWRVREVGSQEAR
jgi:hypothetical protein